MLKEIAEGVRGIRDRSLEIPIEPCDDLEKARLADAGRAGEGTDLARCERQVKIVEDAPLRRIALRRKDLPCDVDPKIHRRHRPTRRSSGMKTAASIASTQRTKAVA